MATSPLPPAPTTTTPPVIPVSTLKDAPAAPISVPQTPPATASAGLTGALQGTQADWQHQLDTAATTAKTGVDSSLGDLLKAEFNGGTAQYTNDAYQQNNVDKYQQDLTAANSQMTAEQQALNSSIQDLKHNTAGYTTAGLQDETQRLTDLSLQRQANIAVKQLSASGLYSNAKAIADRYVAKMVEQRQNQITVLGQIYQANKDLFSTAEQHQFEAAQAERSNQLSIAAHQEMARFDQTLQQSDPDYKAKLAADRINAGLDPDTGLSYSPGGGSASDPVSAASQAILGNESNGSYTAMSPVLQGGTYAGQRSYGKYQVLESNIPSWTKQYYGQSLTPQQFLANPDAQEAVQKGKIGELWNKYGNIQDVASVYFSGVPYAQAVKEGRKDQATGMTVQDYVAKAQGSFNKATTPAAGSTPANIPSALQPYYKTSYDGTGYVDLSTLTPSQKQSSAVLAERLGVKPILTSEDADKLSHIAVTKTNLSNIEDAFNAVPVEKKGMPFAQGISNSIKSFFGDADIRAYQNYRTSAINTLQALAGGTGSGFRITQSEIGAAIKDIPVLTGPHADTPESAKKKIDNLNQQIDAWQTQILGGGNHAPANDNAAPAGYTTMTGPQGTFHVPNDQISVFKANGYN